MISPSVFFPNGMRGGIFLAIHLCSLVSAVSMWKSTTATLCLPHFQLFSPERARTERRRRRKKKMALHFLP